MNVLESATFHVIPTRNLAAHDRDAILALCARAYDVDSADDFVNFPDATHVVARINTQVVSHALWITRWFQVARASLLRTAYVEAVATEPVYQGQGLATAVMHCLQERIVDFEIGGLSPARYGLYARLGWEQWRGPLFVRTAQGQVATPDEEVMIFRLPRTPALELDAPISVEWRVGDVW